MIRGRDWFTAAALATALAALVVEASGWAFPALQPGDWLLQLGWLGLLCLAAQAHTRTEAGARSSLTVASGGLVLLLAALLVASTDRWSLAATLLGMALVAVCVVVSLARLQSSAGRPLLVGLAGLVVLVAATPDTLGQLAPDAVRAVTNQPLGGWLPWSVVWWAVLLGLTTLAHRARPLPGAGATLASTAFLAAAVWAAGRGELAPQRAMVWSLQGAVLAALAESPGRKPDLIRGAQVVVLAGSTTYLATAWLAPERAEALVFGLLAVVAAYKSTKQPVSMDS